MIILLLTILMVMSMSVFAFADEEDQTKEGTVYWYSLEDFWENYNPEDVGYHVVDPMEKIYYMESEGPLEIQVAKDDHGDALLDHFAELTVTWVYSTDDPTVIYREPIDKPEYEVTEEMDVVSFIFSKDKLKDLEAGQRYEFLFTFDDGKAYSLVWATDDSMKLVYTESGHVFMDSPTPVDLPSEGQTAQINDSSIDAVPAEPIAEDTTDEAAETRNITAPIVLVCVIIAAFAIFMVYRMKTKKG